LIISFFSKLLFFYNFGSEVYTSPFGNCKSGLPGYIIGELIKNFIVINPLSIAFDNVCWFNTNKKPPEPIMTSEVRSFLFF